MPIWLLIPIIGGAGYLGYKYLIKPKADAAASAAAAVPGSTPEGGLSAAERAYAALSPADKRRADAAKAAQVDAAASQDWEAGLAAAGWARTDTADNSKKT